MCIIIQKWWQFLSFITFNVSDGALSLQRLSAKHAHRQQNADDPASLLRCVAMPLSVKPAHTSAPFARGHHRAPAAEPRWFLWCRHNRWSRVDCGEQVTVVQQRVTVLAGVKNVQNSWEYVVIVSAVSRLNSHRLSQHATYWFMATLSRRTILWSVSLYLCYRCGNYSLGRCFILNKCKTNSWKFDINKCD